MPLLQRLSQPLKFLERRYAGHPLRLFTACVKTALLVHVFSEYAFTVAPTQGASMLPTFEVLGDWVLISKAYRRGKGLQAGDVVSFDSVVEPGEKVIKRVLGFEGDYVLRDTPGLSDTMIQVCGILNFYMNESHDDRYLRVIVG